MSKRFVVVYEDQPDFITATELADRVLLRDIGWLEESLLESQRRWFSHDHENKPLQWRAIPERARELGIRVRGHFDGEPALPDAQAARRAILFAERRFDSPDAIVLIRDADNQPERRSGLEQARSECHWADKVAIGVANPKRECWIICGFEAQNEREQSTLDAERKNLGTNPCLHSHKLTASSAKSKRNAKRVLRALSNGEVERQRRCWRETALVVLEERGIDNGLAEYLNEIRNRIVRLISGQSVTG